GPGAARSGAIPRTGCARAWSSAGASICAGSRRAARCWCGERRPRRRVALELRQGPGLLPLRAFHDHGRDLLLAHHAVEGGEVVVEQALELRELDVDPARQVLVHGAVLRGWQLLGALEHVSRPGALVVEEAWMV